MTEKGNDALLGDEALAEIELQQAEAVAVSYREQLDVEAQTPSEDEPGKDYPDPDAAPEEEP